VNDIVNDMNNRLIFTILWGCVGARHPQLGTFGQEEGPGGRVVKLTSVAALYSFDSAAELSSNISKNIRQGDEGVRFLFKQKSPQIMSEIIKNDQVVF
jgi:hypothetical protein